MKALHNLLHVRFDVNHNKLFNIGGVDLIRPDEWRDVYEDKAQENVNYLETKPQVCEVIGANAKYPYKVGDKLFVHYMAHESAKNGDLLTNEAFIIADYVFFTILPDGTWKMADGNYLGQQVYSPEKATTSGLIYDIGGKKENLQVKITHIPSDSEVQIGETVLSIDRYNYEFSFYPEKYIRLTENEIVGAIIA